LNSPTAHATAHATAHKVLRVNSLLLRLVVLRLVVHGLLRLLLMVLQVLQVLQVLLLWWLLWLLWLLCSASDKKSRGRGCAHGGSAHHHHPTVSERR
jgi:hypothetical protein